MCNSYLICLSICDLFPRLSYSNLNIFHLCNFSRWKTILSVGRVEVCRVKAQTVVTVVKIVSCLTRVDMKGIDGNLGMLFEDDRSCNFCMTISGLNGINPVFLKNFLIVFIFWILASKYL